MSPLAPAMASNTSEGKSTEESWPALDLLLETLPLPPDPPPPPTTPPFLRDFLRALLVGVSLKSDKEYVNSIYPEQSLLRQANNLELIVNIFSSNLCLCHVRNLPLPPVFEDEADFAGLGSLWCGPVICRDMSPEVDAPSSSLTAAAAASIVVLVLAPLMLARLSFWLLSISEGVSCE